MNPTEYVIAFPGTPKSLNQVGTRGGWRAAHFAKRLLQRDLETYLMLKKIPKAERIEASAVLRFPTKRRRDEGNYRAMLEKSLGDALQAAWIPDDTPQHYQFKQLAFDEEQGALQTTLTLTVWA